MQPTHTFLSKYSHRRRQLPSKIVWVEAEGTAKGKSPPPIPHPSTPPPPAFPSTCKLIHFKYVALWCVILRSLSLCLSPPTAHNHTRGRFRSEAVDSLRKKGLLVHYFWLSACCPVKRARGLESGGNLSCAAREGGGGGEGGHSKEDTDRDEQCFALAAELFLTMLWLTNC